MVFFPFFEKFFLCLWKSLSRNFVLVMLLLMPKSFKLKWFCWSNLNKKSRSYLSRRGFFWNSEKAKKTYKMSILATWERGLLLRVPRRIFQNQWDTINFVLTKSEKLLSDFSVKLSSGDTLSFKIDFFSRRDQNNANFHRHISIFVETRG